MQRRRVDDPVLWVFMMLGMRNSPCANPKRNQQKANDPVVFNLLELLLNRHIEIIPSMPN